MLMKKRHWLAWLCVLMLCAGISSAEASISALWEMQDTALRDTNSMVLFNDKLYYLGYEALEAIPDRNRGIQTVLPYPPKQPDEDGLLWLNSELVTGNGELHLWDWDDGVLYKIKSDRVEKLFQADPAVLSALGLSSWRDGVMPFGTLVQGNYFYVICSTLEELPADHVMQFDLRDGSGRVLELGGLRLRDLTPYKDGKILCMAPYDSCLVLLDGANGELLETIPIAKAESGDAGGLAYDAATDSIYYAIEDKLMRGVGEEAEFIQTIDTPSTFSWHFAGLWNGQYAYYDPKGINLYDLPPVKPVGDAA